MPAPLRYGIQSSPVKSSQAGRTVKLDERSRLTAFAGRTVPSHYIRGTNDPVSLHSRDERSRLTTFAGRTVLLEEPPVLKKVDKMNLL
jgi:hypothetical protein